MLTGAKRKAKYSKSKRYDEVWYDEVWYHKVLHSTLLGNLEVTYHKSSVNDIV